MQNIRSIISELNKLKSKPEYVAIGILDSNITELLNRIKALEERNLRYYCLVSRDAIQVIPTGILTSINFNTTEHPQYGNMHDNAVDNTNIYIRRNGVYYIHACIHFEGSSAGTYRAIEILRIRNGATTSIASHSSGPLAAAAPLHLSVSIARYLYVDDIIQLAVEHDVNPDLDINAHADHSPILVVSERREDLSPEEYGLIPLKEI